MHRVAGPCFLLSILLFPILHLTATPALADPPSPGDDSVASMPADIARLLGDLRDDDIGGNAGRAESLLIEKSRVAWPHLIRTLDSPDPQQRRYAARIAISIDCKEGNRARYDVPDSLIEASVLALGHVRWIRGRGRDETIEGLVAFYERHWKRCAPRLVRALEHPHERIRTWAAVVLVRHSPRGFEFPRLAVKRLFDGLVGTTEFHIADHCVMALYERAVPETRELVRAQYGGDHAIYIASQMLSDVDDPIDPAKPSRALIEVAIDGLADDDIQWNNGENRKRLRAYGLVALPHLEAAFTSQDRLQEQSCVMVAQTIVRAHPESLSRELLLASVDALRDDDVKNNAEASTRFLEWCKDDARALLLSGLSSPDPQQRFRSAYVLAHEAEARDAEATVDSLVGFLDDNEYAHDAQWACYLIYQFGEAAIPAVERQMRSAAGQRRRALRVVLEDLRSEKKPSSWRWYEDKYNDHGLSHVRSDPCVDPPYETPGFRRRRVSPVESFLNGKYRIPPLENLLRDVGRGGVDWKLGGHRQYERMYVFGRRTGGESIWILRVRFGPYVGARPTLEWQPFEASPLEDPWTPVRP